MKGGGAGRPSLFKTLGQSRGIKQPDQREVMQPHSTHLDPQLLSPNTHTLQAKMKPGGNTCKPPCFSDHQISPSPREIKQCHPGTLGQLFSKPALNRALSMMPVLSRNPCTGWLGVTHCPGEGGARPVSLKPQ